MNNSSVVYMLVFALFLVVVGFVCFLVAVFLIAKKKTVFDKELEFMTQRIKKRNELNGRATNHKIDLEQFDNGGWAGEFDSKKHIDLKLNEPHPYYAREADDETST